MAYVGCSKENMVLKTRAVLFDVDDTLFDRQRAQDMILQIIVQDLPAAFNGIDYRAVCHAFAESDRITCEEYDAGVLKVGFRGRRSKLFLQMLGLDEAFADRISDLYVTRYPEVDAPVVGARSVVRNLAEGFQLGVVSNGFVDVQYRKLEALQISRFFDCIVLSEEAGVDKPDPRIFQHAASILGVSPEACLHVGDLFEMDVVGAKQSGMQACWFNPTGSFHPTGEIAPDLEIRQLSELAQLLAT